MATFTQAAPLKASGGTAVADTALAQVIPGAVDATGAILQLGTVNCGSGATSARRLTHVVAPAVGMPVAKSGRTTGLQCAAISEIGVDNVRVQYQTSCGSSSTFTVTFNNQVGIESATFGGEGDSGSLIVEADTAQPVALLFGGDSTTGFAVANPDSGCSRRVAGSRQSGSSGNCRWAGPQHCRLRGRGQFRGSSPQSAARAVASPGNDALARAQTVKSAHLHGLVTDPAVLGVGVGAGASSADAAIVVFVERGKSHHPIPQSLDGLEVRVKEIGPIKAFGAMTCRTQSPAYFNLDTFCAERYSTLRAYLQTRF